MDETLLIVGASARAAAFSALRAGLRPWCVDLFADADLRAQCPARALPPSAYPGGLLPAVREAPPGPWLYTGALENRPRFVERLAAGRPLWGNDAVALRRARSPLGLARLLTAAGLPCPEVRLRPPTGATGEWLEKPLASAGGAGIRPWRGTWAARRVYYQRLMAGDACAAVFVSDGVTTELLGATRQLVGEAWLYARPFCYCGSVGPLDVAPALLRRLEQLGDVVARGCGLRGLFGVDYVERDGVPWPVEVNPRYTASVEVLEYAGGWSALALHRQACEAPGSPLSPLERVVGGEGLGVAAIQGPPLTPGPSPRWGEGRKTPVPAATTSVGKAILFAREALTFPADGPWRTVLQAPWPVEELPPFADLPPPGQVIAAGRPVLTVFTRTAGADAAVAALREAVTALDPWLFPR